MTFRSSCIFTLLAGASLSGCLAVSPQTPLTRPVDLAVPPSALERPTLSESAVISDEYAAERLLWPERELPEMAPVIEGDTALAVPVMPDAHDFITAAPKPFAAASPERAVTALPETGPLELSAEQAVMWALGHNRALSVQQFDPVIAGSFVETELAVFDPVLFADASVSRETVRSFNNATGRFFSIDGTSRTVGAGVSQRFVTGTDVTLDLSQTGGTGGTERARAGLGLTQALLRGGGRGANLAGLRSAEVGALASAYNLRGFAENLVATVENAYWDYALALRQIEIFEESRALAQRQLEETASRIEVGQLAETERAVADAELALRRQQLIDARSAAERARLNLLRLINPPSAEGWERQIVLKDGAVVPEVELSSVTEHEALAMKLRPDLNEARLQAMRGDLDVVQTASGLLPRLDLFVNLGKTGYARSVSGSFGNMGGPGYDFTAGLVMEAPVGNRAARAADQRARASYQQALESVENLRQLVSLDVRTALLEVDRSLQQIDASIARRRLQEEVLRAESARFGVGATTALEVSRVQRDLLESRINEVEAVVNYRRALIDLYRLEGSLLLRRGIAGPGDEEVMF